MTSCPARRWFWIGVAKSIGFIPFFLILGWLLLEAP